MCRNDISLGGYELIRNKELDFFLENVDFKKQNVEGMVRKGSFINPFFFSSQINECLGVVTVPMFKS
jgi:hypothetical protein